MKILLWMDTGFDRRSPSEHLLTAIIEALCESGNTVHVIQKDTGGNLLRIPKPLQAMSVTTDCVSVRPATKSNFVGRYLTDVKYVFKCLGYLRNHRDCQAVFNQSSNVAGVMAFLVRHVIPRARLVYNIQDIFPENAVYSGSLRRNGLPHKLLAAEQRYAYRHADRLITISEDMRQQLVESGAPAERIEVVYNWSYQDELYDWSQMSRDVVSAMFSKDYFNVVYAGNIGVMQNVDLLVEAAMLMKNDNSVWFHIIGEGVYKKKLEAKAKAYGITNLSFWPMQSPELAPVIYSTADVNVIPLKKGIYRTALPSKTATCLACQKPIIFAIGRDSKFGQKVEKETGCPVVESDKAGDLVEEIGRLKSGTVHCVTGSLFTKEFLKSRNSRKYAEIITDLR